MLKMTVREIIADNEARFGRPIGEMPPWGGTQGWLLAKRAIRAGFSADATIEWLYPVGGGADPDSMRGFGPTGHQVRVTEPGRKAVEFNDLPPW